MAQGLKEIFDSIEAECIAEGREETEKYNAWVGSVVTHWNGIIPAWAEPYKRGKVKKRTVQDGYNNATTDGRVHSARLQIEIEGAYIIYCYTIDGYTREISSPPHFHSYEGIESKNQFGVPNFSVQGSLDRIETNSAYSFPVYNYRGFDKFEDALAFSRKKFIENHGIAIRRDAPVKTTEKKRSFLTRLFNK